MVPLAGKKIYAKRIIPFILVAGLYNNTSTLGIKKDKVCDDTIIGGVRENEE
jgi:hypothetical protein